MVQPCRYAFCGSAMYVSLMYAPYRLNSYIQYVPINVSTPYASGYCEFLRCNITTYLMDDSRQHNTAFDLGQ